MDIRFFWFDSAPVCVCVCVGGEDVGLNLSN